MHKHKSDIDNVVINPYQTYRMTYRVLFRKKKYIEYASAFLMYLSQQGNLEFLAKLQVEKKYTCHVE